MICEERLALRKLERDKRCVRVGGGVQKRHQNDRLQGTYKGICCSISALESVQLELLSMSNHFTPCMTLGVLLLLVPGASGYLPGEPVSTTSQAVNCLVDGDPTVTYHAKLCNNDNGQGACFGLSLGEDLDILPQLPVGFRNSVRSVVLCGGKMLLHTKNPATNIPLSTHMWHTRCEGRCIQLREWSQRVFRYVQYHQERHKPGT